jgi:hypothetical protein
MPIRRIIRLSLDALAHGRAWLYTRRHDLPYWPQPVEPPPYDQFRVFLLAGQSNMAGHAEVQAADARPHPRVLSLSPQGRWQQAREPLHRQRFQLRGLGPGLTFGRAMAEAWPDRSLGLVPCALGGSAVQHWQSTAPYRGVRLYARLLSQAQRARQDGPLCGLLWHQGESNATAAHYPGFAEQLVDLFDRLRSDLAQPDLPIFVGEIGAWLPPEPFPHAGDVNRQLANLCRQQAHWHLVPAADLPPQPDRVHFSREAARTLGRRYASVVQRTLG